MGSKRSAGTDFKYYTVHSFHAELDEIGQQPYFQHETWDDRLDAWFE